MKVRIGYSAGPTAGLEDQFTTLVDELERLHFDSVWVPEVLTTPSLDPLTALGFAAGRTTKLKLGTNMIAPGRNPVRLAKELATLDRLSKGRLLITLVLGIAEPAELSAGGVPKAERTAMLDETLFILRCLWAGDTVTHHGRFFDLEGVSISPLPHQAPLEVWFGGIVESSLRRCGRLADGWIPGLISPTNAAAAKATIDAAAAAAGREVDPEHFGANVLYSTRALPPEVLARLEARYPNEPVSTLVPTSLPALADRLGRLVDVGFSKFVLRPAVTPQSWPEELGALAETVLKAQSSSRIVTSA